MVTTFVEPLTMMSTTDHADNELFDELITNRLSNFSFL